MLIIKRDQGFAWHHRGGLHVKGYLFDGAGTFCRGEAVVDYFAAAADADGFRKKLREANGCFAAILETDGQVLAAVDPVRSIPLFYAMKGGDLVLGDDVRAIQAELGGTVEFDPIAREEFLRVGYPIGPNTLDPRVRQIEAGEAFVYDKQTAQGSASVYFSHAHNNYTDKCEDELVEELDQITSRWARRLIRSAEGRTIVVPLSGGYDSRSIVCALKRENCENVICYSYGAPTSDEHHVAKKVASQLGYPIHVIEYNRQCWQAIIESSRFLNFCRFIWQQCAIPFVQELPAVEALSEQGLIPADSVIAPGYMSLRKGRFIPFEVSDNHPEQALAVGIDNYLYQQFFVFLASPIAPETKQAILDRIHAYTSRFKSEEMQDFCSVLENWYALNRATKFLINNVRTYELYGYEWRLPLWDKELIEWWYRIPLKFRVNGALYRKHVFEHLFNPMGVGFRKSEFTQFKVYNDFVRPYMPRAMIRLLKGLYLGTVGRLQPNPVNIGAFQDLTSLLVDQLTSEYDRSDFGSVNGAVAAWCLCHNP